MKLMKELEELSFARTKVQIFINSSYSFVGTIDDVHKDFIIGCEELTENSQVIIPIYKIQYVRIR